MLYKEQKNDQDINEWSILKLPWGKVDPWETPSDALEREFFEETGLHLETSDYMFIGNIDWPLYSKWVFVDQGISRLHLFHCNISGLHFMPAEKSIQAIVRLSVKEIEHELEEQRAQEILYKVLPILKEHSFLS